MTAWKGMLLAALAALAVVVLAVAVFPPGPWSPGAMPEGLQLTSLPRPMDTAVLWNGRAFIQQNLWTTSGEQYAVWVDPQGGAWVARRALDGGDWDVADLSAVPGNPLALPTQPDPHNVYAVAVDADGYVHVAGNMHADPLRYVRSTRPGDLSSWTALPMVGRHEDRVTYPAFVRLPDGDLLFFYRDGDPGGGDVHVNVLRPGERRWRRLTHLLSGARHGASAYLHQVAVDPGTGRLHIAYVWRTGRSPDDNSTISHAVSPDGGATWQTIDGRPRPTPIRPGDDHAVVTANPQAAVLLNQGGLVVDGEGRPHIAVLLRVPSQQRACIRHIWHDRTGWRIAAPSVAPGGRPNLVALDDGSVWLLSSLASGDAGRTISLLELTAAAQPEHIRLADIATSGWEPTYDAQLMDDEGVLSFMVPIDGGRVASLDLDVLQDQAPPFDGAGSDAAGAELTCR